MVFFVYINVQTNNNKTMEKITVTLTVSKEFSHEEINDLVSCALEGGINYWCKRVIPMQYKIGNDFFGVAEVDQDKIEFISDVISYGGSLKLYDAESTDVWILDLEKLLKGIKMYCEHNHITPDNMMKNYDANTADIIVQYALFNEQVFC